MAQLTNHFTTPLYKLIFEEDPPCMSRGAMETIMDIAYWYASPSGTYLRVFGGEKPPHFLPMYATDKIVMQEVSYQLAIGLLVALHMNKKAPSCPLFH